ncbi:MAG: clostripain-related cysteine peptidase [Desulfurococcaceae archaeon]|nr:clostripain-related cysteine peptidase [Desulfurococcaceae archaeon]
MTYRVPKLAVVLIIILMLTSIFTFPQVVVLANNEPGNQVKKWTFMVYIDADNNLDPYAELDLKEMESIGSTGDVKDVNIVALVDLLYVNGTVMYYISKGSRIPVWGNWSSEYELNMGDPKTLAWFINETVNRYPAEHYALILWNHGDNWHGFGWDDTNHDYLSIEEIRRVLSSIDVEIDILGFDACLMSSIEVTYTLSLTGKVDIIVASEEYIPGYGWPYDKVLEKLVENPDMTPRDFAKIIVEEYVKSYTRGSQGFAPYATLSAVELNKVGGVVSHLEKLTSILLENIDKYKTAIKIASERAERFWFGMWRQGPYIDLKDFLLKLIELRKDLETYITPILSEWSELIIACNSTRGPHISNVYGLTIYFPRNKEQFYEPEPYYESVPEFAEATG